MNINAPIIYVACTTGRSSYELFGTNFFFLYERAVSIIKEVVQCHALSLFTKSTVVSSSVAMNCCYCCFVYQPMHVFSSGHPGRAIALVNIHHCKFKIMRLIGGQNSGKKIGPSHFIRAGDRR